MHVSGIEDPTGADSGDSCATVEGSQRRVLDGLVCILTGKEIVLSLLSSYNTRLTTRSLNLPCTEKSFVLGSRILVDDVFGSFEPDLHADGKEVSVLVVVWMR